MFLTFLVSKEDGVSGNVVFFMVPNGTKKRYIPPLYYGGVGGVMF